MERKDGRPFLRNETFRGECCSILFNARLVGLNNSRATQEVATTLCFWVRMRSGCTEEKKKLSRLGSL
jgi:hypothetical protein